MDTNLIDEAFSSNILQVESLLFVADVGTDTQRHGKNYRWIGQIEPIATPDQFSIRITRKGIIWIGTEIGLIEIRHIASLPSCSFLKRQHYTALGNFSGEL